jgi:hypothetical protein
MERPHSTRHLRDVLKRGRPEVMDALDELARAGTVVRLPGLDRRGRRNRGGGRWVLAAQPTQPSAPPQTSPHVFGQPKRDPAVMLTQLPPLAQALPQPDPFDSTEEFPKPVAAAEVSHYPFPRFGK